MPGRDARPRPSAPSNAVAHAAEPFTRLAAQLRQAGRLAESITPLREAARLDPRNAAVHCDLGVTLLKCGRFDAAIDSLRHALALRPRFANGWYNLGLALDHAGREAEAIQALEKAVAAEPRHIEALRQLGEVLRNSGQREAAARWFGKAIAAAPNPVERRLNEARLFVTLEKYAEAETCLRQCVALDPQNSTTHRLLGHVLSSLGKFDDAASHFERAIALKPEEIAGAYELTAARRMTEADRPLIEQMQQVLQDPGLPEKARISLQFALGKTFDDLRDYPAAMRHYDTGNALMHRLQSLNHSACAARFNATMAAFTPESFAAAGGSADETPLLILGMPRSGTTLVEQILSAHSRIAAGGELGFWGGRDEELARQGLHLPPPPFAAKAAHDYLALLRRIDPAAQRVTDKAPGNFMRIGLILHVFPRARIIHCRRNPVDTCLSIYFAYFLGRHEYAYDKDDLAFYYRQYRRLMAHWRAVLPPDRFIEVDYETLIANREAETRRLVEFCGVPWDDACMHPEQNERTVLTASKWQARQPVYTTSVERWRRYEPWIGPLRSLLDDGAVADSVPAPPAPPPRAQATPVVARVPRPAPNLGMLTNLGRNAAQADRFRREMFADHHGAGRGVLGTAIAQPVQRQPKLAEQQRQIGIRLIAESRINEAVRALRDAVRYDPDSAVAHHALGVALMHAGKLDEAVPNLRHAVTLKPDLADAHKDLGIALDRQGWEQEALAAYGRAVALAPKMADVHRRMGDLHFARVRVDAAVACYLRAAEANPDATESGLDRVRALQLQGNLSEAERILREMVGRGSTSGAVHHALAAILIDCGRFDEAITHFERSLALDPGQYRSWLGIVTAQRVTEADRPRIAEMEMAIAREGPDSEARMGLHFALGKAHDDLREYDQAMRHFDAGNQIRARGCRFDAAVFEKRVDRLIARFTPEFFAEMSAFSTADETPLLILGLPRSGTTLTEQILSSHPAVAGGDEVIFFTQHGYGARETADDKDFTIEAAHGMARDYLAVLRGFGPTALRVTDKLLFNFLRLGLIHVLLPRARIIHCHRHPVDTCLSIYTQLFAHKMDFATRKSDLVAYYRGYARLMAHWRAVLPPDRFTEVEYERLITDRDAETRRLVAFAGLDWDDACLRPEQNERTVRTSSNWQVRQPVYTRSMERWRNYEPWLGELRALLPGLGQAAD